ncbi:MAG TPA: hypothetical protein VGM23_04900, partial [Armatimonadota bacterium]
MSSRGFLLIPAILLSLAGGLSGRADTVAPPPATPAAPVQPAAQPATPPASLLPAAHQPNRGLVTYGLFTVQADNIGLNLNSNVLRVDGHVEMRGKDEVVYATKGIFDRKANTGSLENVIGKRAPFTFEAQSMTIDQQDVKRLHRAAITTCSKEHPHYRLLSKELIMNPDQSYDARGDRLEINGTKYFYIPYIRGSLSDEQSFFYPSMTLGKDRIDGIYFGSEYLY